MNDIDKILQSSSRKDLIEFLQDDNNKFDTMMILYTTEDDKFGFNVLERSHDIKLLGLLNAITKYYGNYIDDLLFNASKDEDEQTNGI